MRNKGPTDALKKCLKGFMCLLAGLLCAFLALFVLALSQARNAGEAARLALDEGLKPLLLGGGAEALSVFQGTLPLALLSLSVALAWQGGLYQLGGAGQYALSMAVALILGSRGLPWYAGFLAALAAGALLGAVPGFMKNRFGVHEALSSALLCFLGLYAARALTEGLALSENAPAHVFAALGAGGVLIVLCLMGLYAMAWGRAVRLMGDSRALASYAGEDTGRLTVVSMGLSGLLAGSAGALQVLLGGAGEAELSLLLSGPGIQSLAAAALGGGYPVGALLFGPAVGWLAKGAKAMDSALFPGETGEAALALGMYLAAFFALPHKKGGAVK